MNMYPSGSVVLEIGITALVIIFLFGAHCFIEGFEKEERQRLMRRRYARRWSDQEWLATLKILSDRRFTSLFMVGSDQEDPLPSLDMMWESTSEIPAQVISSLFLDQSEYSIVGEPALQRIPVGEPLGEEHSG